MSRLIDADAIKLQEGFFEKIDNVPKFYDWLNSLPTIDAEPVRHGYWIERYGVYEGKYYKCSVCNYNCSHTKENYCSYCGAKMDGERRNDAD